MRYLFFINPAAGKGKIQKTLILKIDEYFKKNPADYKTLITRFPGDAEQTARKEAQTGDKIRMFACGGEGTCYELVNGIFGFDNVELGVIPCGSANDFLRYFDNTDKFRDLGGQVNGKSAFIDLIKADDRYCINGCSVGMDAMVANNMRQFKRIPFVTGVIAYSLSILKTFSARKLGVKLNVTVDDENLGLNDCLFAVIANAPFYGGGYKGAPDAVPNDGELDFTMVDTVSHAKVVRFISAYKRGDIKDKSFCKLKRCSKMSFKSDKNVTINLDGEIIEATSMDFSIVKSALKFILPPGITLPNMENNVKLLKNV